MVVLAKHLREPISAITHFFGAIMVVIASIFLTFLFFDAAEKLIFTLVYTGTLFFGYMCSTIMHSYVGDKRWLRWLIRLDHAAIFLMIAGSITPFVWGMAGFQRIATLGILWTIAIIAAIWKLTTWKKDTLWQNISYLIVGLLYLLLIPDAILTLPYISRVLVLLGSITIILGFIVFSIQRPNFNEWWGYHEIWHLFVLLGTGFHFVGVLYYLI